MTPKLRLLILSFSPISGDARVLKQLALFSDEYEVTTCGYGPQPDGVTRHIRIPDDCSARDLYGRYITLKQYRLAYWRIGAVAWARQHLTPGSWDIIVANDIESVPVALKLKPTLGTHADLHEYTPRLHEEFPAWKKKIKPFWGWLCRRYVAQANSWTTVSDGLAREYEKEFSFAPKIVTNAAPYAELSPSPVEGTLRLVHSGACLRNRNLMTLIDAVGRTKRAVSLDLYLTANDPGYLEELRERAGEGAVVTVHDPVPYPRLVALLNGFDIGVHVLPPVNFNNEWALPNKLFDYVQARLGIVVGPSAEMSSYVKEYKLGVVADDFSAEALARVLDALDEDQVREFKERAHRAARSLSAESQVKTWDRAVARIAEGDR